MHNLYGWGKLRHVDAELFSVCFKDNPNLTPLPHSLHFTCIILNVMLLFLALVFIEPQPVASLFGGPLCDIYNFTYIDLHWGTNPRFGSDHTVNGSAYSAELHVGFRNSVIDEDAVVAFLIQVTRS